MLGLILTKFWIRIIPAWDSLGLEILELIQAEFLIRISSNKSKVEINRIENFRIDPSRIFYPNQSE